MPTSGDSIINFSGSSPRNWHTLRKLLLFLAHLLPTFLWIFPFNLVLSNIEILHPFMFACYYHTANWWYHLQLWYLCHFVNWCISHISLCLVSPFYLLHSLANWYRALVLHRGWLVRYMYLSSCLLYYDSNLVNTGSNDSTLVNFCSDDNTSIITGSNDNTLVNTSSNDNTSVITSSKQWQHFSQCQLQWQHLSQHRLQWQHLGQHAPAPMTASQSTPAPMIAPCSTPAPMMTPQSTLALMMSNASDDTIFVSESGLQHISSCHPFVRFQHSQLFCIGCFSVFSSLVLANFFVNADWSYHANLLLRSFPMSVWVACLPAVVGNSFLNCRLILVTWLHLFLGWILKWTIVISPGNPFFEKSKTSSFIVKNLNVQNRSMHAHWINISGALLCMVLCLWCTMSGALFAAFVPLVCLHLRLRFLFFEVNFFVL